MSKAKPGSEGSLLKPGEQLKNVKPQFPGGYKLPKHKHREEFVTLRESCYRGREIRIETTYRITIDKKPFTVHTGVSNDGKVHCHAFPNYSFSSAMEMIKHIVDNQYVSPPKNELKDDSMREPGGKS